MHTRQGGIHEGNEGVAMKSGPLRLSGDKCAAESQSGERAEARLQRLSREPLGDRLESDCGEQDDRNLGERGCRKVMRNRVREGSAGCMSHLPRERGAKNP